MPREYDNFRTQGDDGKLKHKNTAEINPRSIGREEPAELVSTEEQRIAGTNVKPEALEREKNVTGRYATIEDRLGAMLSSGSIYYGPIFHQERTVKTYGGGTLYNINIQPFVHPPELIPILYMDVRLRNQTAGEDANLNVNLRESAGNNLEVIGGVTGTNFRRVYDESYLADFLNHTSTGVKKKMPTLELRGSLTGGTGEYEKLTIGVKYEVR